VTLLSEKIKRHTLGTNVSSDATVYQESDKSNYIGVYKSKNSKHLFIYSSATMSSELRMIDADKPFAEFKVFQPRMKNVLYDVTALSDKFLIRTNIDSAKNFKLMECPLDKTDAANWKEVIAHRPDVLLQGVEEFKDYLVISERKDGLIKLRVRKLKGKIEYYLDFGEPVYSAFIGANPEYNSSILRYNYTSLITPNSVYDYDLVTKTKKLMKQQEVLVVTNPGTMFLKESPQRHRTGQKFQFRLFIKKDLGKTAIPRCFFTGTEAMVTAWMFISAAPA